MQNKNKNQFKIFIKDNTGRSHIAIHSRVPDWVKITGECLAFTVNP